VRFAKPGPDGTRLGVGRPSIEWEWVIVRGVDPQLLDGALRIVSDLRKAGHTAYFAGGAVRDLLLERRISDIDIATSAPPDAVEALFPQTIPVGRQFGVVVVVVDSQSYEVATFRRESGYLDGRHPSRVAFSDAHEDAFRRDFTINALFLDPESQEVIDLVDGMADLRARLIRTVGPAIERFREDKLRLMRAVRFACDLDFEIEAETWEQVRQNASGILQVSRERIRDELMKLLTGFQPARGLRLLQESGLLSQVLSEVAAMVGVPQPPQFHPEGDVFIHTCLMFEHSSQRSPSLALAILLHDVGKPLTFRVEDRIRFDGHAEVGAEMAARICRRLRLPNDVTVDVVDLVRDHLRFINVREMRESTLKRFLRKENFRDHLELHRLDCLASHGDLGNYHFCLRKLDELERETMRPAPLLNGHDLIREGFEPGPLFSRILTALEDHQLEGRIRSREQALAWVRANRAHFGHGHRSDEGADDRTDPLS
jgi:poly(A) polymerase